jgi:Undecaprenyl-phosphate glucose phosphotransferase
MLKRHGEFFKSLLITTDFILITWAWALAYGIRFGTGLIPITKGIPEFKAYFALLPVILIVWGVVFKAFDLYRPRRISTRAAEVWDITKACSLAALAVVAASFFLRQFEYSRLVFILFWGLSILFITLNRLGFREVLRHFRRNGYNLRFALVVGAGTLGQELATRLARNTELGIQLIGYLSRRPEKIGREVHGVKVLGTYDQLSEILSAQPVDYVFLALPKEEYSAQEKMLHYLQNNMVDVYIVPDLYQFVTLQGHAELFEGLPLVTVQATPFVGWNRILKRSMDIVFSFLILAMTAPLGLAITALLKLTSRGPVFYRQRRTGYDGRVYEILKFRTMRDNAEQETGPTWAARDDQRRTYVGALLRKTSLDELPQFWNVLKGEMSIVGPRPERPEFVEKFRQVVPRYMLRHKIKAGITGLAQINGWRGDTSLEERIKCDLEYIENWSLALDCKIMWLTIWKGLINKNAY